MQGMGTLTCSLEYQIKERYEAETYGLGALIRQRNKEYAAVCMLFKCSNPLCLNTSFQPTTKEKFSKISLSGDFPQQSVAFPVALFSGYQLLPAEFLIFNGNKLTVENPSPSPSPLLFVSLWSILPDPPNPDFDPGNNQSCM